jgi:hypothetical protein
MRCLFSSRMKVNSLSSPLEKGGVPTCRDGGLHFIQSCEVGLGITRDADSS